MLEGMQPGDVERNPDGSLTLIQPKTCPVGHPLPRIHRWLCDVGGHWAWWCEVCRDWAHQACGCQASGDQAGS